LRSIIKAAVAAGANYYEATVSKLSIDSSGTCTGVQTTDGESLLADHIVLCTGALTAKLIADTAPDNKDLQVAGRLMAAGACSGIVTFAPQMVDLFSNAPVLFNGLGQTKGESYPNCHGSFFSLCSECNMLILSNL